MAESKEVALGSPAAQGRIWVQRCQRAGPYLLVALLGLALLWPSPFAGPLRSADHPVHLTRVQLWADLLSQGQLRGWSWAWFFGGPIGELYPPLSDMLVIAIKCASLGLLSWASAYALAFYFAFCLQGWVLVLLARRLGFSALVGTLAALFALCDPGITREGGWMYTVYFGVWPQALSTSLSWLGLALLCGESNSARGAASESQAVCVRPGLAALAWGAAVLAHPIALPLGVLAFACWTVFAIPRETFGPAFARISLVGTLALGLAAWWLLPMLEHRAWMASYGWLFAPLSKTSEWLMHGQWAQRMPSAVGYAALAGAAYALVRGPKALRAMVVLSLGLWLLVSREVFWELRLDRLSEGFTHIQYQRFLIAAKPGVYLLAGLAIGGPLHRAGLALLRARQDASRPAPSRSMLAAALFALALGVAAIVGTRQAAVEHKVGEVQLHRGHGALKIPDADFAQAMQWLAQQGQEAGPDFFRVGYRANRNAHWFMDAALASGLPAYKMGFTPGDNFVHKPESGARELLDALRVRFVLRHRKGTRALPNEATRFGDLRIVARASRANNSATQSSVAGHGPLRAQVRGGGTIELIDEAPLDLRVRVQDVDDSTQVVFDVAGHPGWKLSLDGEPLAWDEVPARGEGAAADPRAREAGAYRGGRAEGDDGREAILIRARPPHDGELELRFEATTGRSWLGLALSVLSALALVLMWRRKQAWTLPAADKLRPRWLLAGAGLVVVLAALRWGAARSAEQETVLGWVQPGEGVQAGPLKSEMLIRPALRVRLGGGKSREASLRGVPCGAPLTGWIAIDDDVAKDRRGASGSSVYELEISVPKGGPTSMASPLTVRAPHRAGHTLFELPAFACEGRFGLSLRATNHGKRTRNLGVWLEVAGDDPAEAQP